MRRPLIFFLILGLAFVRDADAAVGGVLVGLGHGTRYRTLWLRMQGEDLHLAAELPGLVVPRSTGFWRVGVYEHVPPQPRGKVRDWVEREPWNSCESSIRLWSVPAGTRPVVAVLHPNEVCPAIACPSDGTGEYGFDFGSVTFASPEFVSFVGGNVPEGTQTYDPLVLEEVRRITSIHRGGVTEGIDLLGPAMTGAHDTLCAAECRGTSDREICWEGCSSTTRWHIVRRNGAWRVRVAADGRGPNGWNGIELDVILPETLVGPDKLEHSWPEIAARFPEAIDAFSAPGGVPSVIVMPNELIALRSLAKKSTRESRVPLRDREPIVMIQWAEVREADRWSTQLQRLARQREPQPRVVEQ